MQVTLTVRTALSAAFVEQLLHEQCLKRFDVSFNGIEMDPEGGPARKRVHITFQDPRDRDKFRRAFHNLTRNEEVASKPEKGRKRPGVLSRLLDAVWNGQSKRAVPEARQRSAR